jgi:glyoxylase-like metal-dependent hydrolase (beta-lactamase superfamily II)
VADRSGDLNILLDTCGGNHKDRPWTHRFHQLDTPYLKRLRAAGVAPDDVDLVLCTHLHADHVGWNTMLRDGRWVPTFPNAKYLFSRADDAYWDIRKNPVMATDARHMAYEDSVLPVVQLGQAVLVDDGYLTSPASCRSKLRPAIRPAMSCRMSGLYCAAGDRARTSRTSGWRGQRCEP